MVNSMDEQVEGVVEGNTEDAFNQNKQIIKRLKQASGVKSDRELAKILGIQPQNVTTAKKRRIPEKWILAISNQFDYSANYLLTGEERGTVGTKRNEPSMNKEDGHDYGNKFGDMSAEDWEILGKAYKIINSKTRYRSALLKNINALYDTLSYIEEIDNLKMRIQVLEKVNKSNSSKGIGEEDQNRSAI